MNAIRTLLIGCLVVALSPSRVTAEDGAKEKTVARAQTLDPELAKTGLWVLGGVTALTLIVSGSIGLASVWRVTAQSRDILSEVIRDGIVMRMGTIFGIVTAAGILALCGALTEGVVTFLSGLAGYVLGGIQQNSKRKSPPVSNEDRH